MKKSVKRFFLLGLGLAAVGAAASNAGRVKRAVSELVKKKKLSKKAGEELKAELMKELNKLGKKTKKVAKSTKKKAKKVVRKAKPKVRKAVKKTKKTVKKAVKKVKPKKVVKKVTRKKK